jgi:hypothetical protein
MSAHKDYQPDLSASLCHQFPLRAKYTAQVVVPRDMTKQEADRLCAFVVSLIAPIKSVYQDGKP